MSDQVKNYLSDYFSLLVEKGEQARAQSVAEPNEFNSGRLMAFYEVLSLAQQQAEAFQIPLEELGLDGIDVDKLLSK